MLLEDSDGLPIDNKLPVPSLDCDVELAMGNVTLKLADHVVMSLSTISIFARHERNPGNQVPTMSKSVHSNLLHCVLGMSLALPEKMPLSPASLEEEVS